MKESMLISLLLLVFPINLFAYDYTIVKETNGPSFEHSENNRKGKSYLILVKPENISVDEIKEILDIVIKNKTAHNKDIDSINILLWDNKEEMNNGEVYAASAEWEYRPNGELGWWGDHGVVKSDIRKDYVTRYEIFTPKNQVTEEEKIIFREHERDISTGLFTTNSTDEEMAAVTAHRTGMSTAKVLNAMKKVYNSRYHGNSMGWRHPDVQLALGNIKKIIEELNGHVISIGHRTHSTSQIQSKVSSDLVVNTQVIEIPKEKYEEFIKRFQSLDDRNVKKEYHLLGEFPNSKSVQIDVTYEVQRKK